jgi:hypothetical protein
MLIQYLVGAARACNEPAWPGTAKESVSTHAASGLLLHRAKQAGPTSQSDKRPFSHAEGLAAGT